ncbi:MAG: hypothetical protein QXY45_03820 [Candidatus Aenigmatarchaeota archaeon]
MNLVIVDFDRVLYRTDEMFQELLGRLEESGINSERFLRSYEASKSKYGYFDPNKLEGLEESELDILRCVLETFPYQDFLAEGAIEFLESLMRFATVIILSQGDEDVEFPDGNGYQSRKIRSCNLPSDRIIVRRNKIPTILELYQEYRPENFVVIDDQKYILDNCPPRAIKIRIGNEAGCYSLKEARDYLASVLG